MHQQICNYSAHFNFKSEVSVAWVYLVIAGIFEWGWPVGLKLGITAQGYRPGWLIFAIISMAISGALLLMAQKVIPMGTALCCMDGYRCCWHLLYWPCDF
jgi:multidrug transporter EmrE-like cation transporter